ncbi:hypothetical protein FWH13_04065 [Candidatus Saccharibacteria bacterium]|nr:hypothetical protein [Candidatus Saccharibacteria bacterium]
MEAVTRAMQMGAEARQNMSQYAAPAPQAKPTDTLASTEAYSRAILKAHTTMTERIASAKGSENPEEAIQQAMKTAEATIAEINAAHPEAAAAASAVNK